MIAELSDREMYAYAGPGDWDGDQQLCSECLQQLPPEWRSGWKRVYVPAWIDGQPGYEQCDSCLYQIEYAGEQLHLRLYDLMAMKNGYPGASTHPPGGLACICRQIPGHPASADEQAAYRRAHPREWGELAGSYVPWRWDHTGFPVHSEAKP